MKSLKERLATPRPKESSSGSIPNFDIKTILSAIVKDELDKLAEPIILNWLKSINKAEILKTLRPKKGIDYRDGRDGSDGSPDTPDEIVSKVNKSGKKIFQNMIAGLTKDLDTLRSGIGILDNKITESEKNEVEIVPDTPNEIVAKINKADALIERERIAGLKEWLERIQKSVREMHGGGNGGGGMGNPQHDQFTGDGLTVAFTLTSNVAAHGTAVFGCRYQGQTLYLNDQFTISGKILTMVGFTPEDGTKIEITYIRA